LEEDKIPNKKNRFNIIFSKIPTELKITFTIIIVLLLLGFAFLELVYFGLSFWTDVSFNNDSDEEIKVTPIGIVEGYREIGPIFSIQRPIFFLDTEQNTRFELSNSESKQITYDMDDQNLQFVIVEFPKKDIRILKLDANLWEQRTYRRGCWATAEPEYSIPQRSQLPLCPDLLKPTLIGSYVDVTDDLIDILNGIPSP
jgi:hypothetical protein